MRRTQLLLQGAIALALAACSAASGENGFDESGSGGGGPGPSGAGTGGLGITGSSSGSGGGILMVEPPCTGDHSSIDTDGDGWTGAEGDCNDCTPQMNPGALDYPGNSIDDDCNGTKDDNVTACDASLALDSSDPADGARAIGLCKQSVGDGWGVVTAEYVMADGSPLPDPLGHGILGGFGPEVHPQEGARLLSLSSGAARQPGDIGFVDPGGYSKGYSSGSPPGYPKETPACPGVITGMPFDSAALRLAIKTPTNAKSFHFNLNFYTWEFPVYICSTYNDFFVAMLEPTPQGQTDGNVSFDSQGNNISVNAGFLEVCQSQLAGGKNFPCGLGTSQLTGTGFEQHAATGWLQTSSPLVDPGAQITLTFAIWDSGDGILDSTILLDNFVFDVEETPTVTEPIDVPK